MWSWHLVFPLVMFKKAPQDSTAPSLWTYLSSFWTQLIWSEDLRVCRWPLGRLMWVTPPFLLNSICPREAFLMKRGLHLGVSAMLTSVACSQRWQGRRARALLPCCTFIHAVWQFRSAHCVCLCVVILALIHPYRDVREYLAFFYLPSLSLGLSPAPSFSWCLLLLLYVACCGVRPWFVSLFGVCFFFFYASIALLTYFILIPWCDFNRLYARGGEEGCLWVRGGRKERLKDRDTVQGR